MPLDQHQRDINYLRVSLTDHCNLRCVYCMPLRGLHFAPPEEHLTAEEIATVVRAATRIGFRKVRLSGGAPLLRTDVVEIVRRLAAIEAVQDLCMTTNGVLLPALADELVDAGLHRVNIHLDTLDPDRLKKAMRFGHFDDIWAGIEAAERTGLTPIKINVVVVRGYNETDVAELARLTIERDWHVRFIELMPFGIDACAQLSRERFVPTTETCDRIQSKLGSMTPLCNEDVADESTNYRLPDARGVVGFISPVSAPYCGTCNRMRLTADGKLHLCLLKDGELDVKAALRDGHTNGVLEKILTKAVTQKPIGHELAQGLSIRDRAMFQLGG